jgi:5-methylthioribose kinase
VGVWTRSGGSDAGADTQAQCGPAVTAGDRVELLEVSVADYLRSRGLLSANEPSRIGMLAGGVSHRVFGVERSAGRDLVVKQALARLNTEARWEASTDRVISEAAGLRCLHQALPDAVPEVIDLDTVHQILVLE